MGRGPGRPRDPAADEAILTATVAILARDGYDGLTTDRIATEAGVSKATIYRRWSSKPEVVIAAAERVSESAPIPDTGSLHEDLRALVDGLAAVFADPATARLTGALVARMASDAELAAAMRAGFLAARRRAARAVLERGRARGEVRDDLDHDVTIDLLAAPFYYRLLITGDPIDGSFARHVLDAVTAWIGPPQA